MKHEGDDDTNSSVNESDHSKHNRVQQSHEEIQEERVRHVRVNKSVAVCVCVFKRMRDTAVKRATARVI